LLRELPELSRVERVLGNRADADALLSLLELLRVARDAYAALETYLETFGLTDAKWVLLVQLFAEPSGRLLPSALASRLLVTRGAISGLVRGAERAGLVRRVADLEADAASSLALELLVLRLQPFELGFHVVV